MSSKNFKKNIKTVKKIEEEIDLILQNTLLKEGFGDFMKSMKFYDANVSAFGQLLSKSPDKALGQRIDARLEKVAKGENDKLETAFSIIQRVVKSRDEKLRKIVPELEKDINSSQVDDALKQQLIQKIKSVGAKISKLEMDLLSKIKPIILDPLGVDENAAGSAAPAAAPTAPAATPAAPTPAASTPATPTPKASKKKTNKPLKQKKKADMDAQTSDPNQRELDKDNPEFEESVKK